MGAVTLDDVNKQEAKPQLTPSDLRLLKSDVNNNHCVVPSIRHHFRVRTGGKKSHFSISREQQLLNTRIIHWTSSGYALPVPEVGFISVVNVASLLYLHFLRAEMFLLTL